MEYKLGKRQQQIFDFIKSEIINRGYPPTVREICENVGLKSTSTVHGHLDRLEEKGLIKRDRTKPRAIEILTEDFYNMYPEMINIPILGRVAAGEPILAIEETDEFFQIPLQFAPRGDIFMLEIKGDSMVDAGIFDGDFIIVQKKHTARNGEKIVALIDDSVTCKTFYKEKGRIRLQPENNYMEPIYVTDEQFSILGKVISLYRRNV